MKIRQEAQHPPPQTQAERKGVHNLLTQAVFDIGTPILHTLICAGLNLMFSKTETTIRPNSSVLIKWGTPQNFLLAFIDELWNFWKIRILKKWKKHCWRYHHFKHVYQKPQSYEVQFLRYGVWQIFFVILDHFLPFYPPPPNKSENKSFEKSICRCHILNLCNTNHYHMMYAYSNMESSRQLCYFRQYFALLPHYWPEN